MFWSASSPCLTCGPLTRPPMKANIRIPQKILFDPIFDFCQIDLAAEQPLHRRYRFAFARDDPVVVAEIGIHVQCKTVRRDPSFDVNADRGDLAFDSVNAGQAFDPKASMSKSAIVRISTSSRSRTYR